MSVKLRLGPLKRWAANMKRKSLRDVDARKVAQEMSRETRKNLVKAGLKDTGSLIKASTVGAKGNFYENSKDEITYGFSKEKHDKRRTFAQLIRIWERKGVNIMVNIRRSSSIKRKWMKAIRKSVQARGRPARGTIR